MATVNGLIERLTEHANRNRAAPVLKTYEAVKGRKYIKIVEKYVGDVGGAAHCFIDEDGNIYKPAGWAAPAKGIRANLETLDLAKVDCLGGWLYR